MLQSDTDYQGIDISVYHSSGEEFQIIVVGDMDANLPVSIANNLVGAVRNEQLPSDAELRLVAGKEALDGSRPSRERRRITISIGVASTEHFDGLSETWGNSLLQQADDALYRAKSMGRDRVTHLDDILHEGGRVLEFDDDTGVVVLDIGKTSGVTTGTGFRLLPPKFTGDVSYKHSDGRSEKILGKYPSYWTARVTVFSVSDRLSFATVSESRGNRPAGVGYHARLIPLGHIDPMEKVVRADEVGMTDESIVKWIRTDEVRPEPRALIVGQIRDYDETLQRSGSESVNEALRGISNIIARAGARAEISVASAKPRLVAVVKLSNYERLYGLLDSETVHDDELPDAVSASFALVTLPERFRADAAVSAEHDKVSQARSLLVLGECMVDIAVHKQLRVVAHPDGYSSHELAMCLYRERIQGRYDEVLRRYEALLSQGITSLLLSNHAALSMSRLGHHERARDVLAAALSVEKNTGDIYQANLGLFSWRLEDYQACIEYTAPLHESSWLREAGSQYRCGFVVSLFRCAQTPSSTEEAINAESLYNEDFTLEQKRLVAIARSAQV